MSRFLRAHWLSLYIGSAAGVLVGLVSAFAWYAVVSKPFCYPP